MKLGAITVDKMRYEIVTEYELPPFAIAVLHRFKELSAFTFEMTWPSS
jgi:hypothetical protein